MSDFEVIERTAGSQATWTALAAIYPDKTTPQDLVKNLDDPDITIRHVTGAVNGFVNRGFAYRENGVVTGEDGSDTNIVYIGLTEKGAKQAKAEGAYVPI